MEARSQGEQSGVAVSHHRNFGRTYRTCGCLAETPIIPPEKGFHTMEVRTITEHKTLQTLARYTHLRAEDLAERIINQRREKYHERGWY